MAFKMVVNFLLTTQYFCHCRQPSSVNSFILKHLLIHNLLKKKIDDKMLYKKNILRPPFQRTHLNIFMIFYCCVIFRVAIVLCLKYIFLNIDFDFLHHNSF